MKGDLKERIKNIKEYANIVDFPVNIKVLEDEDIEIEIYDVNDYRTYKIFNLIGIHQVERGNIKEIRGTCIRDKEKKLYFVVKKELAKNFLENFNTLMIQMQDTVCEAAIGFEVYSSDNFSTKESISSEVMTSIFLLEESGTIIFDIEKENIFININGMEPISENQENARAVLKDINNNKRFSNIFAEVGPPQDLSEKIHTDEDARKAAITFSEGRKSLENLLYFCFTNNIKTFASCAGHEENLNLYNDGYIAFNIEDEFTRKFIEYLNNKLSINRGNVSIEENIDSILIESIHCNYQNADHIFREVLEILQNFIIKDNINFELNKNNELNKKIDIILASRSKNKNQGEYINMIKNYKDRLPSEEEIKKSLDRYFGFMHSKINMLASDDFSRIIEMSNKGWNMDSSKEEIEELIQDFVNIYGYIYSKGIISDSGRLVRGTTTEEVKNMKEGKLIPYALSTTKDEYIAKRFCEYEKAALIRIRTTNNLPYVYIENLKENSANEEEVLILPFSKVKKIEFTSNWDGYKYYDVVLEKEELPELSEERITELKNEIIYGYEDFVNKLKEYKDLSNEYEALVNRRGIDRDYKKIEELMGKIYSYDKQLYDYKMKFQEMLKGMCKQREKDIDLQQEEKMKVILDELKHREEIRIEKIKEDIRALEENLSSESLIIQQDTEKSISDISKLIEMYREMSKILGIKTFNSSNLEDDLQIRGAKVIESLEKEINENNFDKKHQMMEEKIYRYEISKQLLQQIPGLLKDYAKNSILNLKYNVGKKAQEIIYKTAYERLNNERQMLLSQKDSLLNKLLGKTRVNNAKINNIEAKIAYITKKRDIRNLSSNIEEILCDMYECAHTFNDGNLTIEMAELENAIRQVFKSVPDKEALLQKIIRNNLPVPVKNKGIFSWISNMRETKRLNNETILINQNKDNLVISKNQEQNSNINLTTIYSKFSSILENVRQLISELDYNPDMEVKKQVEAEELE